MDTLSHGLFAALLARFARMSKGARKAKLKLNAWLAFFFGIFPDIASFGPLFLWMIFSLLSGTNTFGRMHPETAAPTATLSSLFGYVNAAYNVTHSIIVFAAVVIILYLIFRNIFWEMGGWLLHILLDIPTRSYQFYPTPFLWPISDWKFDGFSWGTPWFIALTYSLLAIGFFILFYSERKKRRK